MDTIRKDIPTASDTRKDVFCCTEYNVGLGSKRVVAAMHVEQYYRTKSMEPLLDEEGQATGEMQAVFGEWEPYRKYYPSGQYPVPVFTDNSKLVDPLSFEIVEAGTEGSMGEATALWLALENKVLTPSQAIELLMDRMIASGFLDNPFAS